MSCNQTAAYIRRQAALELLCSRLEGKRCPGLAAGQAATPDREDNQVDCRGMKWEGHEINTSRFIQPERLMHSIRLEPA